MWCWNNPIIGTCMKSALLSASNGNPLSAIMVDFCSVQEQWQLVTNRLALLAQPKAIIRVATRRVTKSSFTSLESKHWRVWVKNKLMIQS